MFKGSVTMTVFYAIEWKQSGEDIEWESFYEAFFLVAVPLDEADDMLIYQYNQEADEAALFLEDFGLLEASHAVYQLHNPLVEERFSDYGFTSNLNRCYLYEELVLPFIITSGEKQQIDMALLQIKEDLIALDQAESPVLFIDKQMKELVQGYADAYKITISFLLSTNRINTSKME